MTRGRFITLEGIEGAGKTTAVGMVRRWLESRGLPVIATREPGGTPLAERVRAVVLERNDETLSPAAETLLMFAARAIHLDNRIRPALDRGESVVCDRFTDATRAYQGGGRGVDRQLIDTLSRHVQQTLEPDCTLLLDLPVELGLQRARSRGDGGDRFEDERAAFFERVRAAYLELARTSPARIHVIDAARPPPDVDAQIGGVLGRLFENGLK